jgi:hypothetical protein
MLDKCVLKFIRKRCRLADHIVLFSIVVTRMIVTDELLLIATKSH